MTGITINRHDDRLIAVKGSTPSGADRRFREAQLLARLDHPGVVQFVELIDGETVELHMQYAGADTWEHQPPTDAAAIVRGLAAVASTVADLHDLGTAHRALVPDHVIVAADGRPVLCGLSDASASDPATMADDLAGLAGLIRHLSPAAGADLSQTLDEIATRATTGELTARTVAVALNTADQPERRERRRPRAGREGSTIDTESGARTGPALRLAAIVGALAVIAAAGWIIVGPTGGSPSVAASDPSPPSAEADPPLADPPEIPSASTDVPDASTATSPTVPTVAADSEATRLSEPALEFVHDGRRYGLGEPGDVAVLGDWNCDGVPTPALLQPATGVVAVFLSWPGPDASAAPDLSARHRGALDLVAVEVGDCHQLRVVHPDGSAIFNGETP